MPTLHVVAAQRTPIDHEALRAALAGAWHELAAADVPSDAISILMAQSALETGRWERAVCWNLGGIKGSSAALHTYYPTRERFPRLKALAARAASTPEAPCQLAAPDDGAALLDVVFEPPHPVCRFRAYPDLASSARDYLGLLVRKYPAAIARAAEGDTRGYVDALRAHRYFTGDVAKYQNGVEGLFDEYRDPCLSSKGEVRSALERLGCCDVRTFQRVAGLVVDGALGARTRAGLRARLSLH